MSRRSPLFPIVRLFGPRSLWRELYQHYRGRPHGPESRVNVDAFVRVSKSLCLNGVVWQCGSVFHVFDGIQFNRFTHSAWHCLLITCSSGSQKEESSECRHGAMVELSFESRVKLGERCAIVIALLHGKRGMEWIESEREVGSGKGQIAEVGRRGR